MVTLQNLIDHTNDFCASYSVTTVSLGNVERGINRAIEFVQRRLGLPSDKAIQSFWFYEDTPYYNCATGFNELIGLKYNTSANSAPVDCNPNTPRRRWNVYKDIEIIKKFVNPHGRLIARKRTGVSANHQRQLASALKRARFLGLLPFVVR